MTAPFLSLTDADREAMLETIGVDSIEELFRDIPEPVRFRGRLDLDPRLSEPELVGHLAELASRNVPVARWSTAQNVRFRNSMWPVI